MRRRLGLATDLALVVGSKRGSVHVVGIELFADEADLFVRRLRSEGQVRGDVEGEASVVAELLWCDARVDRHELQALGLLVEAEDTLVGEDTARATAPQARALARVAPFQVARAGVVEHALDELAL